MKTNRKTTAKRIARVLIATFVVGSGMTIGAGAKAALVLNAAGIADGFSLSTFYTDPAASYGLLGAVNAPGGTAIGSAFFQKLNGKDRPNNRSPQLNSKQAVYNYRATHFMPGER